MKYQLHDCELSSISLENNRIILSFPNGFCIEDNGVLKLDPSRKTLAFTIDKGLIPNESLDSFFSIRLSKKGKSWKNISFNRLTTLFRKRSMLVYDEFDSKLGDRKLFQLNSCTDQLNIELLIEDITDITY